MVDPDVSRSVKLYHYTSLDGFMGIVRSRSFWASDIRYMNDSSEYRLAFELGKPKLSTGTVDSIVAKMIQKLEIAPIYIVSLSEKSDDLGQWRGYTPNGIGVCFALSHYFYEAQCKAQSASIAMCSYLPDRQRELINNLLDTFAEVASFHRTTEKQLDSIVRGFWIDFGARMKHNAFEQEAEWRIVAEKAGREEQHRTRNGKSTIIPYIEFPICEPRASLEFEEVVVGPSPNQQLAVSAVARFLDSEGCECKTLRSTGIPLLAW